MQLDLQKKDKTIIKVIGVGGGGGNAVAYMHNQGIVGVDFAICNTDSQALEAIDVPVKIVLGPNLTEGRGAGAKPEVGKEACIESIDEVRAFLSDSTKMLFITAGMGGGTGTGAAPIIAKAAREMGILTVAIITLPFRFEGPKRKRQALEGLEQLKKNVDSILVISNDKLRQIYGDLQLTEAFAQADSILATAAKGIAEVITVVGNVNVDFNDVYSVMKDGGVAIMGHATEEGDHRAVKCIEKALNSPLLEDNDIRGAKNILLNITSGSKEVTMDEVGQIADYIENEAGFGTDLFLGTCKDDSLGDKIGITIIATGFKEGANKQEASKVVKTVTLDEEEDITEGNIISNGSYFEPTSSSLVVDFDDVGFSDTQEEAEREITGKNPHHVIPEEEMIRREELRKNTPPLDSSQAVMDIESVPAYKRRNVGLDDVNEDVSHLKIGYTVSVDDDGPVIRKNNSFLYDNVD